MAKTVRFSELVKKSGQPYVVTLWTNPKKDREFVKAMHENRVLTIKQEPVGAKKDFGVVGFREEKNVSYFIFPKPLPDVGDTKVIGIKYDMVTEPKVRDRIEPSKLIRKGPPRSKGAGAPPTATPAKPPEPKEKQFIATIRRTAVWETTVPVTARNQSEAEKQAESAAKNLPLKMDEAVVRNEVRDIHEEG